MKIHCQKHRLHVQESDLSGSQFDDVNLSGGHYHNINLSGCSFDDPEAKRHGTALSVACGIAWQEGRLPHERNAVRQPD
jgi:uncharacterized protein YjbI with pentapeptide repeats